MSLIGVVRLYVWILFPISNIVVGLCWTGPTLRGTRYGMAWLENKSNIPRVDIAFIGHKSHSNPTHDDGVNIIHFKVVNNIINRSLKNDFYSFPGQQLQRTSQKYTKANLSGTPQRWTNFINEYRFLIHLSKVTATELFGQWRCVAAFLIAPSSLSSSDVLCEKLLTAESLDYYYWCGRWLTWTHMSFWHRWMVICLNNMFPQMIAGNVVRFWTRTRIAKNLFAYRFDKLIR